MIMIGSATTTFTRENLKIAYEEYLAVNGQEAASAALKSSTGASDLADVPENKVVVGVAHLVSSLTVNKPRMSAKGTRRAKKSTLASIASRLDEIREKAFARGAT